MQSDLDPTKTVEQVSAERRAPQLAALKESQHYHPEQDKYLKRMGLEGETINLKFLKDLFGDVAPEELYAKLNSELD